MNEYWESRARKYGHTGWSDLFIYAFDQQARLLAIEEILKQLTCNRSFALDFGAGVGDFSNLLSKYFYNVTAFDISTNATKIAKKKYGSNEKIQFTCSDNIEKIKIPENTVDCILSVTVLDHILEDYKLVKTVRYFESITKSGAVLILLEYSLDHEKNRTSYQRFRKLEEWISIFSECNFCFYKYYNFYHPLDQPCISYKSYRNSIKGNQESVLRVLARLGLNHTVEKYLTTLASIHLERKMDFFWEENEKKSPLKIMIFKKV